MLKDASEAQKEINVTVYLLGHILHFLLNKNIVKQMYLFHLTRSNLEPMVIRDEE